MISAAARAESFLVADSPAMRAVADQVRAFADGGAPVVICGEHGTGRELVARILHQAGPRRAAPFVAVRPTFEGADVPRGDGGDGADARAARALAAARGGTLLVKDITDLSAGSQRTLRAAIDGGATDVQVVATADPDLARAVDARIVARAAVRAVRGAHDRRARRCATAATICPRSSSAGSRTTAPRSGARGRRSRRARTRGSRSIRGRATSASSSRSRAASSCA